MGCWRNVFKRWANEKNFQVNLKEREAERARGCFIRSHFADLIELGDFTILVIIMVKKTSIKTNVTNYKTEIKSLRNKNAFNCTFPPKHTYLQRNPRTSWCGIMVGKISFLFLSHVLHYSLSVANHVIYLRNRSQLTGTFFLLRWF